MSKANRIRELVDQRKSNREIRRTMTLEGMPVSSDYIRQIRYQCRNKVQFTNDELKAIYRLILKFIDGNDSMDIEEDIDMDRFAKIKTTLERYFISGLGMKPIQSV